MQVKTSFGTQSPVRCATGFIAPVAWFLATLLFWGCGGAIQDTEPKQHEPEPTPEPKDLSFEETSVAKPAVPFVVEVAGLKNGSAIPEKYAFCGQAKRKNAPNLNPEVKWSGTPEGTMSYVLLVVDPDVPADAKVVKRGRKIPEDAERMNFYHWVVIDIQPNTLIIEEGQDSDGVTAKGKAADFKPYGKLGINDYTKWFANDKKMAGEYHGYDGPCPPRKDQRVHSYRFELYALREPSLKLEGSFDGAKVVEAMEGYVIEKTTWTGTYTLNPKLK